MRKCLGVLWLVTLLVCSVSPRPRVQTLNEGKAPSFVSDSRGNLFVAYESLLADNDIYLRRSTDGSHWDPPINVSHTAGISSQPSLTVETDGSLDLAWSDTTSGRDHPDIYFSRSLDGGLHWTDPVDVSGTPRLSRHPRLVAGPQGALHIVWSDTSRNRSCPDLFYAFSYNHGKSWSKPRCLSGAGGLVGVAALVCDPRGRVHLAWQDGRLPSRLGYRQGEGDDWQGGIRRLGRDASQPSLAWYAGKPWLSWLEGANQARNSIQLSNLSSSTRELARTPGISSDPTVLVVGKRQIAAWVDTSAGQSHPDVWIREGRAIRDFSQTPGISHSPALAGSGQRAWVCWEEIGAGSCWLKVAEVLP